MIKGLSAGEAKLKFADITAKQDAATSVALANKEAMAAKNAEWAKKRANYQAKYGYKAPLPDTSRWPDKGLTKNVNQFLDEANTETPATQVLDKTFIDLLGDLREANAPLIHGEIPDDVVAQIEQVTAEQSLSRGLGSGSAARNLTARDLGKTSLDIRQLGMANAKVIADLTENRRQFDKSRQLDMAKYITAVIGTNLTNKQLDNQVAMFNAEQSLKAAELTANTAMTGAQITYNYQAAGMDSSSFDKSLNKLLKQLGDLGAAGGGTAMATSVF